MNNEPSFIQNLLQILLLQRDVPDGLLDVDEAVLFVGLPVGAHLRRRRFECHLLQRPLVFVREHFHELFSWFRPGFKKILRYY